ncbi:hypothetical protein J1605_001211 [Eschrichtius robustus]|uniref:Uncharacterized protein n=1 Tax=Eschrichtius robustus TaxID=9764 RepID=A0AB34GCK9_ESCRO|nr:hypothetical protein J1605_001211 [Eschrichtius robustus]
MPQPMPRLIYLQRRPTDQHFKLLLDPGLLSQATFGANDGQRPNGYFLLGNPAAPAQDKVLTSPAAQPPRVSTAQSGLPGSLFVTAINTQPAFGDNAGILPRAVSIATGFGVANRMPSTGDSSSLFANTTPGPMFPGPAAPTAGGSLGVRVSAPGLAHSEASRPLNSGAGLSGAPSTTSVPALGQTTCHLPDHSKAAAVGGAGTIPAFGNRPDSPLNPNTWGLPGLNTGGLVMAGDNTILTMGGPRVSTFCHCTQGPSGCRKSTFKSSITKEKKSVSRGMSVSTFHQSTPHLLELQVWVPPVGFNTLLVLPYFQTQGAHLPTIQVVVV